jgi:sialate O-acetylesterase
LAAYGREGFPEGDTFPLVRDQQSRVAANVPHTAMAVAMDVGSAIDIHPRHKQPVGHRLALLARALVYREPVEYSGPVFHAMEITGNSLALNFDHANSGLACPDPELKGFQICGDNRKYYPAQAQIMDHRIVLHSPEVDKPAAAAYGWANYMDVNLYNGAGLPAVPFRTDRYL